MVLEDTLHKVDSSVQRKDLVGEVSRQMSDDEAEKWFEGWSGEWFEDLSFDGFREWYANFRCLPEEDVREKITPDGRMKALVHYPSKIMAIRTLVSFSRRYPGTWTGGGSLVYDEERIFHSVWTPRPQHEFYREARKMLGMLVAGDKYTRERISGTAGFDIEENPRPFGLGIMRLLEYIWKRPISINSKTYSKTYIERPSK